MAGANLLRLPGGGPAGTGLLGPSSSANQSGGPFLPSASLSGPVVVSRRATGFLGLATLPAGRGHPVTSENSLTHHSRLRGARDGGPCPGPSCSSCPFTSRTASSRTARRGQLALLLAFRSMFAELSLPSLGRHWSTEGPDLAGEPSPDCRQRGRRGGQGPPLRRWVTAECHWLSGRPSQGHGPGAPVQAEASAILASGRKPLLLHSSDCSS